MKLFCVLFAGAFGYNLYPLILPGTEDQQVIVSDRWRYSATNQIRRFSN